MKIGLDLRFLKGSSYYERFIYEFAYVLVKLDIENDYTFYVSQKLNIGSKRLRGIIYTSNLQSRRDQHKFGKYLMKEEQNDLMIFFDENIPMNYSRDFLCFIPTLENLFYTYEKKWFKRFWHNRQLSWATKHSKKIICFDKGTKSEINERLNIVDDKIIAIPPFFPFYKMEKQELLDIDIKAKYGIKTDYLIYDGGDGIYKNIDRMLDVFTDIVAEKKDISLLVFGEAVTKDLNLRQVVIDNQLQNKVFFLGTLNTLEEKYFYTQSLGVIFPSLYEPFPFYITKAIFYNVPIVSSNIDSIVGILGNTVTYCNPLSRIDMAKCTLDFLRKNKTVNYSSVLERYNSHKFTEAFLKEI